MKNLNNIPPSPKFINFYLIIFFAIFLLFSMDYALTDKKISLSINTPFASLEIARGES